MKMRSMWGWFPVFAAALGGAATTARADEEADHEALRGLKATYERALNEDKLELLKPHLAEGFTGVMMTSEPVAGFEALQAYWVKMKAMIGAGGKYTTTLSPERSWIQGDVAVARGTAEERILAGSGREYRIETQWTALCVKRDGRWQILRAHGSMDPLGNEFVKTGLREIALASGGGMFVIGALAGGFLVFLILRRRRATGKS